MSAKQAHVYLVFSRPAEGRTADYNAWYDGHHVPEVLASSGEFLAGRRYEASAGGPPWRYLMIYEINAEDVGATHRGFSDYAQRIGLTSHGGALDSDYAAWVYSPVGPSRQRLTAAEGNLVLAFADVGAPDMDTKAPAPAPAPAHVLVAHDRHQRSDQTPRWAHLSAYHSSDVGGAAAIASSLGDTAAATWIYAPLGPPIEGTAR